ncbi:DUF2997 domain-containing protein [Amphritea sp. 2_MG-2023]|uniref:DUF2997 domain-containing protein n=1 Tax=Amphritea TaxID=515417 RepID=UPI001C0691D6|nr:MULTISPECIES: DUF2997 domain-containing protein [Amphritea]MBU2964036.1 DUF2997 domain-containing protein [Amphritea atlantica]MDO6418436.1 DUF2997 domain-containing protein [Amphritea sp. 2_MG-2023]
MPEQRVVITIDEEGSITAKTSGFKGESCLAALDDLLDLDGIITNLKKTDEYHQRQTVQLARRQEIKRT